MSDINILKTKLTTLKSKLQNLTPSKIKVAVMEGDGVAEVGNITLSGAWNFKNNSSDITSELGDHATKVASVLLNSNPNVEVYSLVAQGMDITTSSKNLRETFYDCMSWCINNKIDIVNMSLGFNDYDEVVDSYLKMAYDNGIILVAAIGNNSTAVSFPASSPYVIGVSNWNESTNSLDSTSSYGIGTDFAIKGTNLTGYGKNGTLLTNLTGTSFACPNLCGVIAELLAKDRTLKFEQIHKLLRVNSTYDSNIGWGVITTCPELPDTIPTEKELLELEANNEVSFEFNTYNVKTYDKLKFNLVYSNGYKKTILKQLDETIAGVSTVNDGNLVGLLTGETYIYATDKFGIKNFSKVIVSNTIDSSYGENVEVERVTTERGFNFDEQNISAVLDSGIDGTGIKVGIMGYTISGAIADLKIKTIKNVTGSSNNSNDQKDINMISTITSSSFGYAPNCDLYYVEGGDSSIAWADAKTGINWFISNKVDVAVVYGNKSSDNNTLITNLNNAGIIVIAPYVAPSTNATNPHIANTGVIHVGWVDPNKKVAKDMAFSALPPTSDNIDCVGYGYGIKSFSISTLDPCISTIPDNGGAHFQLCLQACCQVAAILALMKQQYPKMNNTAKAKKLLPYLCSPISGYATNRVGNGLITAKLSSELNLSDDFFNI